MPYTRPQFRPATGAALTDELGLEGFWDDVYKVAQGVATGARVVQGVKSGQQRIAVVPSSGPSVVTPIPGTIFGAATPALGSMLPVLVLGGLGLYLLLHRR